MTRPSSSIITDTWEPSAASIVASSRDAGFPHPGDSSLPTSHTVDGIQVRVGIPGIPRQLHPREHHPVRQGERLVISRIAHHDPVARLGRRHRLQFVVRHHHVCQRHIPGVRHPSQHAGYSTWMIVPML